MKKGEEFKKLINEATSTKERLFLSAVYLYSTKGYANVGIRELCRSVDVKESAFYNHYRSKDELFAYILDYFVEINKSVVFTEHEIKKIIEYGDVELFFIENMRRFSQSMSNPLYHTIFQIVFMESFINPYARDIAKNNLYNLKKGYTEKILNELLGQGHISECNVEMVTMEYYYALMGFFNEYLLCEVWDEDTEETHKKILEHLKYFINLIKKN